MRCYQVRDVMTADPMTVTPATPLKNVADLLVRGRIGVVPALTPQGRVAGVVAEGDLLRKEQLQRDPDGRHSAHLPYRIRRDIATAETAGELMDRWPAELKATRLRDVISMRALVVYESMYGNTRVVASEIADSLRVSYEVRVVPVAEATAELVAGADLLVVGAPTHMHGLSSASSRRTAAKAAAKDGSELRLDPDAGGPGLHDWLKDLSRRDGLAAAFDTRINGVPAFTGRASRPIAKLLKRHGYRLVASPESFLVSSQSTLLDGEAGRARRWGMTIGAIARTSKSKKS